MEMAKSSVIMLICIFMHGFYICGTTSCHQKICNCRDDMIFCIDMAVPSFDYRPSVTRLYLKRVQLLEMGSIIRALPNLLYLSSGYGIFQFLDGGYSPKCYSNNKYVYG